MDLLSSCIVIFFYFNQCKSFNKNLTNFKVFYSNTNITFVERGIILNNRDGNLTDKKPTDFPAIQIIIFSGTVILIVLIGLLLCNICCKHFRRDPHNFIRSSSTNSIEELIRARMLDRPPSYAESQTSLNTAHHEDPPPYSEIISIPQTTQISSRPIYTISTKISSTYANNDLDLPYMECESDTDSLPSYHTSEGIINPILLRTANNSDIDVTTITNSTRELQNVALRSEFYI